MTIQTARCTVRPFEAGDLDAFMAYRNDMDWMRHQGFKGLTRQEYEDALLGPHALSDGVQLALVDDASGELVGDVYLKQADGAYWLGYTVRPASARMGYAQEAAQAVIGTLRAQGAARVMAGVEAGNAASIALLKKLGFRYLETDDGEQIFALEL